MFISENIVPTLHERDPAIVHSIGQHTIGVEVTLSAAHLRHNVLRSKIVQGWVSAQLTRFVPLLEIKRGLEHEREKGESNHSVMVLARWTGDYREEEEERAKERKRKILFQ